MIRSWKELSQEFSTYLQQQSFDGNPAELYRPISYTIDLGGKRIRPTLSLLATQLFGKSHTDSLDLAVGVEVFHNFTLVHDDIMDEAPIRRGKDTVYKKWNRDVAILSGDVMLIIAYQFIAKGSKDKLSAILDLFNRTAIEVCEGQQLDMNFEDRNDVELNEYIEMIRLKTAVLLACSLKIGALKAGASEAEANLLYDFGEKIGIAFQIQDDYLDAYANPDEFGKRVGGDIITNKKTFLYLAALERADEIQQAELNRLYTTQIQDDDKVEQVLSIFSSLGISTLTKEAMENYFEQGMQSLNKIKVVQEFKQPLIDLAEQLMNRTH